MLTVAIAVEPPAQPEAAVVAVAESCQAAIGEGRCQAEHDLAPGAVVAWVAVVTIDEENPSSLQIDFHDRSKSGALIESRALNFAESDRASSRWASAGTVIAAFVAARADARAGEPPPSPPPSPPAPVDSPPKAPASAAGAEVDVDLALLAGPGLDTGSYRLGALARVMVTLPETPHVLGLVSARYAERPSDVRVAWWSVACGFGARVGAPDAIFHAELTGEFVFERMLIDAEDPATGRVDDGAQNRFGGRLSLNGALGLTSSLALVVGAEASALRPAVTVVVGDQAQGRDRAVGYGLSTGLRMTF
jgi:hypothetical protein